MTCRVMMGSLGLAVRENWLRWLTPEGKPLPTPMELVEQERQRANEERQRTEQAEQMLAVYRRRFGNLE